MPTTGRCGASMPTGTAMATFFWSWQSVLFSLGLPFRCGPRSAGGRAPEATLRSPPACQALTSRAMEWRVPQASSPGPGHLDGALQPRLG